MKLNKFFAGFLATAVAATGLAVTASAADATGEDGEVGIAFASSDWNAQYWLNGEEFASKATKAVITGDGTYTVAVEAATKVEDEETGEEVVTEGASGLAFAAVQVVNGETLFPGMVITIDSVSIDGVEQALSGTPYTSSDEGITTRVNLYNEWVSSLPDDARTVDGLADDATPTALSNDIGDWTKMEVTFTVTGADGAVEAADAEDVAINAATGLTADEVNDNGYFRIVSTADSGEAALFTATTDEVLKVYGVRYYVTFDQGEVDDEATWIGGGVGANSESTGWEMHEWGKASGEKEITPDFSTGIIEWMDTEPVFASTDTYAHLWLQTWGGTVTIDKIEVLDANKNVLWATGGAAPAVVEDTSAAVEETTTAVTTGDVSAATDSSKGSPDTGIADVAAVAGLAVVAAGALVVAKKRK